MNLINNMLNYVNRLLLCVIFIASTNYSFSQEVYSREDIIIKLDEFLTQYKQLSNFGPEYLNARTSYTKAFDSLFVNNDKDIICNDLPQLFKNNLTLNSQEYCNLLFSDFPNGLIAEIKYDSISIVKAEDSRWDAMVMITKTLYGSHYISDNNISFHLKINLLYDKKFKITKIISLDDSDLDGLNDNSDDCISEYGFHKFKGCPDMDLDNIVDEHDRCPDSPEGQQVNKYGCYKYYYSKMGFMEIDVNPMVSIYSQLKTTDKSSTISNKPLGDLPENFQIGSKYGLSLVKAIKGNYINRIHALKIGAGIYRDAFTMYLAPDTYESNTVYYHYHTLGYRQYSTHSKLYYGAGIYLMYLLDAKSTLTVDEFYTGRRTSAKNYNRYPLGFYSEMGIQMKISDVTYFNLGLELIYFNQMMDNSTQAIKNSLSSQLDIRSNLILGLKTSVMFDLTGGK